jgi:nickel-dependent lactate racemase
MLAALTYGRGQQLEFHVPALAVEWSERGLFPTGSLAEVGKTLQNLLAAPRDFPPLNQAIVPGDQIVIAVGPDVPRAATLIAAVVKYLLAYDVNAEQICILQTQAQEQSGISLIGECPESIRTQLAVVTHHPQLRDEMGYLAADEAGEQILFHRRLIEADMIIPILAADLTDATADGTGHGLYPIFADEKAQQRFHQPPPLATKSRKAGTRTAEPVHLSAESPEWLLGVLFGVQVVAGGKDEILQILAGSTGIIRREAARQQLAAWQVALDNPVETLIATVTSPQPLSWDETARITARLLPLVKTDGSLLLCADVQSELPPALQQWAASGLQDDLLEEMRRANFPGWNIAVTLSAAREHARLYLLSNLAAPAVEDLGWTPLKSSEEITRLLEQSDTACLLHNADRVICHVG